LKFGEADATGSWDVKDCLAGIQLPSVTDSSLFSREAAKLRATRSPLKEETKLCVRANIKWRQDSRVFYMTRNDTVDIMVRSTGYGKQCVMSDGHKLPTDIILSRIVQTVPKTLLCVQLKAGITALLMENWVKNSEKKPWRPM
jgi:hypothetical protein